MRNWTANRRVLLVGVVWLMASCASAQDWPQWRGPNRDAKVTGFVAPKTWPKELSKKWSVKVGEGVASPALVGDKLYVFVREDGNEIIRCLDAANGKELWQDKYEAQAPTRPGSGFNNEFVGPRSSPTVADGKVVMLGARGTLSCYDTAAGKLLWRKDDFKGALPDFFTSCSPVVVDGLCIVQLGSKTKGGVVAYDLASGDEKWKWTGDGTAYSSPVLANVDGAKVIVAETAAKVVALNAADGKELWQTPFPAERMAYNAATPMVDGQTVIYSGDGGRGTKAVKLEKSGGAIDAKELWSNKTSGVKFNTPVLKDGLLFGITERDNLFCINEKDGKTAWSAPVGPAGGQPSGGRPAGPPGGAGGGGRPGGMGGRAMPGYGSVVDVGPVLIALTPSGQVIVFEPNNKEFKQLAKYKVAEGQTYAYPVISGNRVFIKDRDSLTLWTIE